MQCLTLTCSMCVCVCGQVGQYNRSPLTPFADVCNSSLTWDDAECVVTPVWLPLPHSMLVQSKGCKTLHASSQSLFTYSFSHELSPTARLHASQKSPFTGQLDTGRSISFRYLVHKILSTCRHASRCP